MLGLPLHYLLKNPAVGMAVLAANPLEVWTRVKETYLAERELREPACQYEADETWERRLHEQLGVAWPCERSSEFWSLWSEVVQELCAKGIQPGPMSFGCWNDGDAGFVRAIWCLVHHLKPKNAVETGVAHGVTSRFILEALARADAGCLASVDLPPIEVERRAQVAIAVDGRFADRWSYIEGSSRLHLSKLLAQLGQIDLFIHDSLHSERNVRFELDRAWEALRPGGAMVVDDIDANRGFQSFTESFSGHRSMICEAEPLRPDPRRFNQKGLFGIILKDPAARG